MPRRRITSEAEVAERLAALDARLAAMGIEWKAPPPIESKSIEVPAERSEGDGILPNDSERDRSVKHLRYIGWKVPQIAAELGIGRSTVYRILNPQLKERHKGEEKRRRRNGSQVFEPKECKWCEERFTPGHCNQKFCSKSCSRCWARNKTCKWQYWAERADKTLAGVVKARLETMSRQQVAQQLGITVDEVRRLENL
jgi:transposase